jgi:hypothetical protein
LPAILAYHLAAAIPFTFVKFTMARKRLPEPDLFTPLDPAAATLPAAASASASTPAAEVASASALPGATDGAATAPAQDEPPEAADPAEAPETAESSKICEPRLWADRGWTARVIKNEDDEGWAVAMTCDGESEPALVGPWTMGRDKKNPKPLDANAFNTLVKTAAEVIRRHEQQLHAMLHKSVVVSGEAGDIRVTLDIVPDEDHPYAMLAAFDAEQVELAKVRVSAGFKLSVKSADQWIANEFRRPD